MIRSLLLLLALAALPIASTAASNSVLIKGADGKELRITPYGEHIVRLQARRANEAYLPDDAYDMVESHRHGGRLAVTQEGGKVSLHNSVLRMQVDRASLAVTFWQKHGQAPVLQENGATDWRGASITRGFVHDPGEHFTALGHGYFGRADTVDLKGQRIARNYGANQIDQAPLLVPFYISSKGYGVFLNSTFPNTFQFGVDGRYDMAIDTWDGRGRMDYFFIAGPQPKDVLQHYVALTGKPRLPPKSMFGLALSDKGHDHTSPTPSDAAWWVRKVDEHRAAGFPLDHLVNDNRWRAAGGERCRSKVEWDRTRFPDPAAFKNWMDKQGLVSTLDFNRCIAQFSEGWRPAYNLPEPGKIDFSDSAPDLSNAGFRTWFWKLLYEKSLRPQLQFPGDALWIDEFDEMGVAPAHTTLANGHSYAEMRNYWFFLISQSLVKDGWDQSDIKKRPFVWVRGMGSGAQRYATLWSGDIKPSFEEMKLQIRGMQLAGLSGFPYWGHDAGGFFDWDSKTGPDAELYKKWSMAMGSFSPIWKPHGMGPSRWPLDRSAGEQAVAHKFAKLRYELMPYIYSAAHETQATGMPMVRAMLLDYPAQEAAWKHDLQYMWGPDLLVAPFTSGADAQSFWLPPGKWWNYLRPERVIDGGGVNSAAAGGDEITVMVKAGALIPRYGFAKSTAFIDKAHLVVDVFTGADGKAMLVEDDDVTEEFRTKGRASRTALHFGQGAMRIDIGPARGSYAKAPQRRSYLIRLHGAGDAACFAANGKRVASSAASDGAIEIVVSAASVAKKVSVERCRNF
ncbi:MAG: TIM-barrel domain-containing protein [Pseudomonadota bacterium]